MPEEKYLTLILLLTTENLHGIMNGVIVREKKLEMSFRGTMNFFFNGFFDIFRKK